MMSQESTIEQFMAALEPYAQGQGLIECEKQSGLKSLRKYLWSNGQLKEPGKAIYNKLPLDGKAEVDAALIMRLRHTMSHESVQEQFMAALEPYAQGKSLLECEALSDLNWISNYLSNDGQLRERAEKIYMKLPPEGQSEVNAALAARRQRMMSRQSTAEKFMAALEPYAQGKSFKECESLSTLKGIGNYASNNGQLTKRGEAICRKLPPEQQAIVDDALARRIQFMSTTTSRVIPGNDQMAHL